MASLFPELDGAIEFFIDAEPVAQPRQRHAYSKGLGRILSYIPKDHPIHVFKEVCRIRAKAAHQGKPLEGPLAVRLLFLMPRPSSVPKLRPGRTWKAGKPDLDNQIKGIFDALNKVLWQDDGQIAELHSRKMYAAIGEACGVHVMVSELT